MAFSQIKLQHVILTNGDELKKGREREREGKKEKEKRNLNFRIKKSRN